MKETTAQRGGGASFVLSDLWGLRIGLGRATMITNQHDKPTEGMCCLCTMEDITEEDQNYGERKRENAKK